MSVSTRPANEYSGPYGKTKKARDFDPIISEMQMSRPPTVDISPDPFVVSDKIVKLSSCYYEDFLSKKDVALVLFYGKGMYNGGKTELGVIKQYVKAAEKNTRPNTSFATADCTVSARLCKLERVDTFPYIAVYSRGHRIGQITDPSEIGSKELLRMINTSPVLEHAL